MREAAGFTEVWEIKYGFLNIFTSNLKIKGDLGKQRLWKTKGFFKEAT